MNKVRLGNCTLNSKHPLLTRERSGSKVGEHCPSLFSLTELSFSKQERTLDFTSISQTMLYKTLHKGIYLPKHWRKDMYRWQKEIVCQLPIPRNIISYISLIYLCYTKRTDMDIDCITFYSINILEIFFSLLCAGLRLWHANVLWKTKMYMFRCGKHKIQNAARTDSFPWAFWMRSEHVHCNVLQKTLMLGILFSFRYVQNHKMHVCACFSYKRSKTCPNLFIHAAITQSNSQSHACL